MKIVTLPLNLLLHLERPLELELEDADLVLASDPVDLGA